MSGWRHDPLEVGPDCRQEPLAYCGKVRPEGSRSPSARCPARCVTPARAACFGERQSPGPFTQPHLAHDDASQAAEANQAPPPVDDQHDQAELDDRSPHSSQAGMSAMSWLFISRAASFSSRVPGSLRVVADWEGMERTERVERTGAILAPPLMTVAEAARVARVSQTYVRKLIARGTIGAVRVGDREAGPLRIPTGSFERWLFGGPPRTRRRLGVGGR